MRIHQQQGGMVSIIVTMLMMIIISLIVLGFAQVSRREQRQSLDAQLSTQAYYAAESGINDARSAILNMLSANPNSAIPDKTNCGNDGGYPTLNGKNQINSAAGVSYPCLLIDATPTALTYSIGGGSTVVPLSRSAGAVGAITLTWNKPAADSATSVTNCYQYSSLGKLPPASGSGAWSCPYGLLQADLVALPGSAAVTRANLATNTKAIFFEPVQSASVPANRNSFSMASDQAGTIVAAKCDNTSCQATITGMSANRYFMRINSVYKNNFNLRITNNSGSGFTNAQASIDATGKAQDVLRRIRVAIDLTDANASAKAGAALETQDSICKRFSVANGYYDNSSAYPGGVDNQLCETNTTGTLSAACIAPHDIILVLDASSSMNRNWEGITRLQEMEKVASVFVDSTGVSSNGNHVGVVTFNQQPGIVKIPFSYDSTAIKSAINSTTLFNATIYMAGLQTANTLFSTARPGVPKVMIFISDGEPYGQTNTIIPYANSMRNSGIIIYTIGIVDGDNGKGYLQNMASNPPSTYYTTASTQFNFESFFGGISSQVTC